MKTCIKHFYCWATQDFKQYKCIKCGKTFFASSCPSHKVCNECSDKYNLCIYCGCKTNTNEVDKNEKLN